MQSVAPFSELQDVLQALFSEWQTLAMMIREDKPKTGDSVLVDIFGDQVDNWLGLLTEATAVITQPNTTTREATTHLVACHACCNDIRFRYIELVSYERMQSFVAFGREQGGEWQRWVQAIKQALEMSQDTLFRLDATLIEAWKGLAVASQQEPINMFLN